MSENFTEKKNPSPSYIAYSVEEGKDNNSHWQKIGAAWDSKGGGLSLKLNTIPLDGRVALRSREELERIRAEKQNAAPTQENEQPKQEVTQKP